jgi:hypothetical protein
MTYDHLVRNFFELRIGIDDEFVSPSSALTKAEQLFFWLTISRVPSYRYPIKPHPASFHYRRFNVLHDGLLMANFN